MFRSIISSVGIAATLGWASAPAADDSTPQATLMISSADEVLRDLEVAFGLTSEKQKLQWPTFKDYLEVFLSGIDRTQPIRIDAILAETAVRFRSTFPLTDFKLFREENLDTFGIESIRKTATLYQLKMAKEDFGWMRYERPWGIIAEVQEDVPIKTFGNDGPVKFLQPLLDRKYDVGGRILNRPEGQEERRKAFQKVRDELLAAVKQKQDEPAADFELRKLFAEQVMNELDRFFVEASSVVLGWTTDAAQKQGRLEVHLEPIPGTELEKTVQQFNTAPSHFANVTRDGKAILNLRVNHPLDTMRQGHLLAYLDRLRDRTRSRIDGEADSSVEVKTNRKHVADLFFDMLAEGAKTGLIDGFMEVHQDESEEVTTIGGVKAPKPADLLEILKLLPGANFAEQIDLDFDKEAGVALHKVILRQKEVADWESYLAEDGALYLGTDDDTIWFAAGADALPALKAAIQEVAKPNSGRAEDPFVDVRLRMGPWLKLRDQRVAREEAARPKPAAGEPQPAKVKPKPKAKDGGVDERGAFEELASDVNALRKLAIEAAEPGDDTLAAWMKRVDNRIEGQLKADAALLRFGGAILAKFTEDNLAE